MRESEALEILERLHGSEIRIEEAAEALRPAAGWDPEEPEPVALPEKLHLSGRVLLPLDQHGYRGWFIRDDRGGIAPLAIYHHGAWPRPDATPERLLAAMVGAYNREREEERIEAQMDDAKLDEGLERICREEVAQEVETAVRAAREEWFDESAAARRQAFLDGEKKGAADERAACLSIFDWLLASLPQGWDYARRMTEAARRKVESGKWVGVPTAAGEAGAGHASPVLSAAVIEKPDQFTPELKWSPRLGPQHRMTAAEWAEADRRWEEEPRLRQALADALSLQKVEAGVRERLRAERNNLKKNLREAEEAAADWRKMGADALQERDEVLARIGRAVGLLRSEYPATTATVHRDGSSGNRGLRALYSILTGKES